MPQSTDVEQQVWSGCITSDALASTVRIFISARSCSLQNRWAATTLQTTAATGRGFSDGGENTRGLWGKGRRPHSKVGGCKGARIPCSRSYRADDLFPPLVSRRSLIGLRVLTDGASSACRPGGLRAPCRSAWPTARRRGVTRGRHAAEPQTT